MDTKKSIHIDQNFEVPIFNSPIVELPIVERRENQFPNILYQTWKNKYLKKQICFFFGK